MNGRWPMPPSLKTSLGHAEHAGHGGNRETGLVRAHEPEEPDDTAPVSRANQAAAFDKISCSTRNCLFSRRSRDNSSRSAALRPGSAIFYGHTGHGSLSSISNCSRESARGARDHNRLNMIVDGHLRCCTHCPACSSVMCVSGMRRAPGEGTPPLRHELSRNRRQILISGPTSPGLTYGRAMPSLRSAPAITILIDGKNHPDHRATRRPVSVQNKIASEIRSSKNPGDRFGKNDRRGFLSCIACRSLAMRERTRGQSLS